MLLHPNFRLPTASRRSTPTPTAAAPLKAFAKAARFWGVEQSILVLVESFPFDLVFLNSRAFASTSVSSSMVSGLDKRKAPLGVLVTVSLIPSIPPVSLIQSAIPSVSSSPTTPPSRNTCDNVPCFGSSSLRFRFGLVGGLVFFGEGLARAFSFSTSPRRGITYRKVGPAGCLGFGGSGFRVSQLAPSSTIGSCGGGVSPATPCAGPIWTGAPPNPPRVES